MAANVSSLQSMRKYLMNEPIYIGGYENRAARRETNPFTRPRSLITRSLMAGAVLFLAVAPGDHAQQTPGGFTSVEYFAQPNQTQVKTRLSGAEAQPLPGGLLVIKQLKLETFTTDGTPQAIVEAPECIYDTVHSTANSAGHLHLRSGDGRIRTDGDGFLWRQDDSFLTISNHVHTVIETGPGLNFGL